MANLKAINIEAKRGNESFSFQSHELNFNLTDFWSWSQSDLLNNTLRGVLAEYIVRQDLGIKKSTRTEWDAYDLETKNGIKIEIKSAAYLQSWKQNNLSQISFNIAPTKGWNAETNEYSTETKRQSDYYVFCLLHHKDKSTVDPTKLEQWTFYVLQTHILNKLKKNRNESV
ncbi:hypothetical protein OOZ15_02625 [Galbibacter sp. EGI 63066]|uniref:hypothetical protein n=1 Tax=Galbibacter sp. EGI 63066 TaxID=2993559 RepID=UPI002249858D|nr:hypothetical protein [Galbibacter sp. EGI 63066]MCX2678825.1 hypothetical protein [Galbibacter sp. EGI 63066]